MLEEIKMASHCAPPRSERKRRPVMRLIDEQLPNVDKKIKSERNPGGNLRKDKNFYEAEIKEIDADNNKVLVHFTGYPSKYDEWKEIGDEFPVVKVEKYHLPDSSTVEERAMHVFRNLYCEVKKKLRSDRKDDPNVRVEINIDNDIFDLYLANLGENASKTGNTKRRNIVLNSELDDVLGRNWYVRVKNALGDFGAVIEGTVQYWLTEREPLSDYFSIGNKFFPYKIEQCPRLAFTFLRENGNAREYKEKFR